MGQIDDDDAGLDFARDGGAAGRPRGQYFVALTL
jgi:hypothetical protein